jgi:RNA recognition motif-containing protein
MSRRSDNPAAKVIVRNYPLTTPEKELRDMFEKIGKIDDFFMPQFKDTRKPRGFFFVQYRKEEDAHDSIKSLNGTDVGGMKLAIEMVRGDKRERDRGGRDSWRDRDRGSRRRSRSPIRDRRRSPPSRDRDGRRDWDSRYGDSHGPPGQDYGRPSGFQGIPPGPRRALLDPPGPPPGMQGSVFPPHEGMGPPPP